MKTMTHKVISSTSFEQQSALQRRKNVMKRLVPQGSLLWYPCYYTKHLGLHLLGKEDAPHRLLPHVVNHNIRLDCCRSIYLYIPKVACSSMKKICVKILGLTADQGEEIEEIHRVRFPAAPKFKIHKHYQHYFKFAFVRNPWDRLVSCYRDKVRFDSGHVYERYVNDFDDYFAKMGVTRSNLSFTDFVELVSEISDENADAHFRSQSWFLHDSKGNLLPNFVGRFENLKEDFEKVANTLNLALKIPHLRKTSHAAYTEWYNERTRALITRRYANDIRLFDYTYGD